MRKRKNYYVVIKGRNPGIYREWEECKEQTDGFSGAKFKGFEVEADAKNWFEIETIKKGSLSIIYLATDDTWDTIPESSEDKQYISVDGLRALGITLTAAQLKELGG